MKDSGKLEKDVTCNDLFEDLLHEKSFDLAKFTKQGRKEEDSERAKFSPEGIEAKKMADEVDLAGLDEKEIR